MPQAQFGHSNHPSARGGGGPGFSNEDEINAALIQQMMEEDENEMLAQ